MEIDVKFIVTNNIKYQLTRIIRKYRIELTSIVVCLPKHCYIVQTCCIVQYLYGISIS